jgi:Protein of unknown function (DUF3313)
MQLRLFRAQWVAAIACALALAFPARPQQPPPTTQPVEQRSDPDELERVSVPGLQIVYARPRASLAAYDQIILDPIEVSFHKSWDNRSVAGKPITADEKLEIRQGLAKILRDEFARSLNRTDRYRVTERPGETVLQIRAEVRDLIINAPDVPRAGTVRTYTLSTGEMTLTAEIRDSITGDIIARVIDHKKDPESVWFELTTSVDNVAAARTAARSWANVLTQQLDLAHRSVTPH